MQNYSVERKEAMIKKMLPPLSMSVSELMRMEGIPRGTLYSWKTAVIKKEQPVPENEQKNRLNLSAIAKLSAVVETIAMNEIELSIYCREKGYYPQEVKQWKQACIDGQEIKTKQDKETSSQSKVDKQRIRELERELNRKEKALAETAALLVLRKKLNALWENEVGEN